MVGIITWRHVLCHPVLIIRGFGWSVLGHCFLAVVLRQQRTFLAIISE